MGKQKRTRKCGAIKRRISPKDSRLKQNKHVSDLKNPTSKKKKKNIQHVTQLPTALFFKHNTSLGPPYRIIVDTNFINFSIKKHF